jgi:hypothetical protein
MGRPSLVVTPVNPDTLGQLIYEVKDETGAGLVAWIRKEDYGHGLAMTSRGPTAEVDYWQALDPEEWDREMGGLATYAELYEAVCAA